MAIQILQPFQADPVRFGLPRRIDLSMVFSSTEASERVRVVYSLPADANVVFDDGSTEDERSEKVARAATPIAHRLNLRRSGAATPAPSVRLTQDVFDAVGTRTRTRVNLAIDGARP